MRSNRTYFEHALSHLGTHPTIQVSRKPVMQHVSPSRARHSVPWCKLHWPVGAREIIQALLYAIDSGMAKSTLITT